MRARNAKPGLYQNADLAERGPVCQLLFQGLSLLADREGRLKDDHRWIKGQLFPYYDPAQYGGYTVEDLLKYLAEESQDREHPFIVRYEIGKSRYIQIVNFKIHNRPHMTERASIIPPPPTIESPDNNGESTVNPQEIKQTLMVDSPLDNGGKMPDSLTHRLTDSQSSDSPTHRLTDSQDKNDVVPLDDSEHRQQTASALAKARDQIPYEEIVSYLNERTGKDFRHQSKATRSVIRARWEEGYRLDDFRRVIDIKAQKWCDDPKFCDYLRPQTLFGTKFESYLNESRGSPAPILSQVGKRNLSVFQAVRQEEGRA